MSATAIAYQPDPNHWDRDFQFALTAYREGERKLANDILQRLVHEGSQEPLHLSYAGLLLSEVQRAPEAGLDLCAKSLVLGFLEPEIYLNHALVELAKCDTRGAVETLRRGLRALPGNPALIEKLHEISPRRTPAFSVVGRGHWVNRSIGRLRAMFS